MHLPTPSLDALVPDVALNILSHLSPRDLTAAAAVSRQYCKLAQDDLLWRRFSPSISPSCTSARRQHIRRIAWRTGRAVHSARCVPDTPVHAVRLLTEGRVAYMTSSQVSNHSSLDGDTRAACGNYPVSAVPMYIPFSADRVHAAAFASGKCDQVLAASLAQHDGIGGDRQVSVHSAPLSELHNPDTSNTESEGRSSFETNCENQLKAVPIFSVRRTGVTSISVSASNQATVVFGTTCGSLFGARQGGTSTHTTRISSNPVTALSITPCGRYTLAGSAGGEVLQVDIETGKVIRSFVGPCSCVVSATSCTRNVVIAGVRHAVAGNGHGSLAVAWDIRAQGRLAAFCRGSFGASSAIPLAPALNLATVPDAPRVALLVAGQVYVYDMASWSCFVHADFGDTLAMDIDEYRLALFCRQRDPDLAQKDCFHVLDFDKAVEFMPHQVTRFQPNGERMIKVWIRKRYETL